MFICKTVWHTWSALQYKAVGQGRRKTLQHSNNIALQFGMSLNICGWMISLPLIILHLICFDIIHIHHYFLYWLTFFMQTSLLPSYQEETIIFYKDFLWIFPVCVVLQSACFSYFRILGTKRYTTLSEIFIVCSCQCPVLIRLSIQCWTQRWLNSHYLLWNNLWLYLS